MNTTPHPLTGAYTQPITVHLPDSGSGLNVRCKPGTDFDERFIAWCEESRDFIRINGWMVDIESRGDTAESREGGEGHV